MKTPPAAVQLAAAISFVKPDTSNRFIVVFTLVISYIFLVSYRVVLMNLTKHAALDIRHVAVIGSGTAAQEFARTIQSHHVWGLKLVGVFNRDEVRDLLEGGGVDELILVADREGLDEFTDTFLLCEELGVTARVVLNFFPHSTARMELHEFDGFPLLSFSTTPTNEVLLFVRRILDVALASLISCYDDALTSALVSPKQRDSVIAQIELMALFHRALEKSRGETAATTVGARLEALTERLRFPLPLGEG